MLPYSIVLETEQENQITFVLPEEGHDLAQGR